MAEDFAALEPELLYRFHQSGLLARALTHKSWAFENSAQQADSIPDNEQLEFLGDAVLGLLVSEALLSASPELSEGRLSQAKARFVSKDHLHAVAVRLNLGAYLRLGRGEEMSGGRAKPALLANCLEALIGAIYLDGGIRAARQFVEAHVLAPFDSLNVDEVDVADFKGALQELVQSLKLPPPRYRVVSAAGPEHCKRFCVEVAVGEDWSACADGPSKKSAGRNAAAALLKMMKRSLPAQ